jgi:aminopeptidase N
VTYYNLNVDVDIAKKYLTGWVEIYFTATEPFDTMQIDLYQNMRINKIILGNNYLQFTRKYNAVFITMPRKIEKGEKYSFSVYYEGHPETASNPPWEGGFVWKKDKKGNPWIGVCCEVDGASLWWPVKDHLSDEPDSMALNFTVPAGLLCVSNGHMIDSIPNGNKVTYKWKVTYPINTYDATLYIGNFKHFIIPYTGIDTSFNLDFYVLPENLDTARQHFKQTTDILKLYETTFGPYPWPRDGYKLVESPYEGMENQTAIAYGNHFKNEYNLFDYIIVHESAHEWWGNSLTVPDYSQIWLHEGFATYSEALYMEHLRGYDAYQMYLKIYSWFIKNKRPVIGPSDVNYWDYKDADVYMKGALVLHTLRNILNDDTLFFNIIKTFYKTYAYKIVTTDDFVNIVSSSTGKDYSWFFRQYLYDRICPRLEYRFIFNPNLKSNELYYRWGNINNDFPLPIKVIAGSDTRIIIPSNNFKKIDLQSASEIEINPDNSYIALKRVKNFK